MKQIIHILAERFTPILILLAFCSAPGFAQLSMSRQILTIQVVEFNKVGVGKSLVPLDPLVPGPGEEFLRQGSVATASARLVWTSNGGFRKISVESRNASQSCVVRIKLDNIKGNPAASAGEVELQDRSTHDLLRGISKSAGSCNIRFGIFRAEEESVEGHYHSIVYTIASG